MTIDNQIIAFFDLRYIDLERDGYINVGGDDLTIREIIDEYARRANKRAVLDEAFKQLFSCGNFDLIRRFIYDSLKYIYLDGFTDAELISFYNNYDEDNPNDCEKPTDRYY